MRCEYCGIQESAYAVYARAENMWICFDCHEEASMRGVEKRKQIEEHHMEEAAAGLI